MRKRVLIEGLVFMLILSGCRQGEHAIDSYGKSEVEQSEELGSNEGDNTKDNSLIPDKMKCVLDTENENTFEIDADVISMGMDQAKIYTINPIQYDEKCLMDMASKIFDNGEYTPMLPYAYWNEEDLIEEQKHFEEMLEEEENKNLIINENIQFEVDTYAKEGGNQIVAPEDIPSEENHIIYNITEVNHEFEKRIANLRGKVDGKDYELYFDEVTKDGKNFYRNIRLRALFPISSEGFVYNPKDVLGENTCNSDELRTKAEDIIRGFGFNDFVVAYEEDRICKIEESDAFYDGMSFFFVRDLPELTPTLLARHAAKNSMDKDGDEYLETPLEYINVDMGENDLIEVSFQVAYELGETISDVENMLSLDQANDVILQFLKEYEQQPYSYTQFEMEPMVVGYVTDIRLSYIPILSGDQYVYVPAWVYECSDLEDGNRNIETPYLGMVAVSALDGQLVRFVVHGIAD